MKKNILNILIFLLPMFFLNSCSMEDDLDEIFYGKTWYFTGAKINGNILNADVKNFYKNRDTYLINFTPTMFSCTLSNYKTEGKWNVDGKTRDMCLSCEKSSGELNTFDNNLLSVIKKIQYYKGDWNIITIYADNDNYISLSKTR